MPLTIGVVRESAPGEHRVALVPETAKKFQDLGAKLVLENTLGLESHFMDSTYEGATFDQEKSGIYRNPNLILRVAPPTSDEIGEMPEGSVLIGLLKPFEDKARLAALNARKITAFALELLPRISRAQSMDALSSQGSCAGMNMVAEGYYAVKCVHAINAKLKVAMPIAESTYRMLYEKMAPTMEMRLLSERLA